MVNLIESFSHPFSYCVEGVTYPLESSQKAVIIVTSILAGIIGLVVLGGIVFYLLSTYFKQSAVDELQENSGSDIIKLKSIKRFSLEKPNELLVKRPDKQTNYLQDPGTYSFIRIHQTVFLIWKEANGKECQIPYLTPQSVLKLRELQSDDYQMSLIRP